MCPSSLVYLIGSRVLPQDMEMTSLLVLLALTALWLGRVTTFFLVDLSRPDIRPPVTKTLVRRRQIFQLTNNTLPVASVTAHTWSL